MCGRVGQAEEPELPFRSLVTLSLGWGGGGDSRALVFTLPRLSWVHVGPRTQCVRPFFRLAQILLRQNKLLQNFSAEIIRPPSL